MGRNIANQLSIGIVSAVLGGGPISSCFSEPNNLGSELRERCGKRTEEIWNKKFGIDDMSNTNDGQIITKYENHYNAKLDKCFYLTISNIVGKKKVTKVERLFDVDENKEYGRFTGGNGDTFHICVMFVGKGTHKCSSEDEWRGFIKQYMEDAN